MSSGGGRWKDPIDVPDPPLRRGQVGAVRLVAARLAVPQQLERCGRGAAPAADTEGPGPVSGASCTAPRCPTTAWCSRRRGNAAFRCSRRRKCDAERRQRTTSSCGTAGFSQDKDQQFIFCPDFNKGEIAILNRKTLETIGAFGSRGGPGQFQNRQPGD